MLESMKESVKEGIKEAISEFFADIGPKLAIASVEFIRELALYGGLISIILYAVGYQKAIRYPGPLFAIYVLVKYIFGGVA